MPFKRYLVSCCVLLFTISTIHSQNGNLLDELQDNSKSIPQNLSHFKSTRIILGPSTTQISDKELQVRISHLFGPVTDGIEELYGLDQIYNVDIALDYGIMDWLSAGLARSSDYDKTVQTNVKLKLLQQSEAKPFFSLSYLGGINVRTRQYTYDIEFVDRLEYIHQLLMSYRFNSSFVAQLTPGWVHLNRVPTGDHPNSLLFTGIGVSYMISPSTTLNVEYNYVYPTFDKDIYEVEKNALSLGVDIDTGGHVFQLFLSNATRLQPSGYIAQWNNDNFFDGDIHIGFSIMRSFNL
ncbi:DUF5777 family beta-barrel protein [Carboxylicivirga marina]|uniref:DUF5777 domain-containing protein n=1 Tax=Carboxylicivirga marina TaxID=2800988 RepID=A0ABS1HQJ9_9BACT|nr:DUF5777 family beta-barrel protein [Carboxylicivirga marina]MBK3519962.1 hypothetical protein [Carboxylicivirga marina]